MKKVTLLSALTLSAAILIVGGATANAAEETKTLDTEGTVNFVVDDSTGEIIEPNEKDDGDTTIKIPATDGKGGSGAIRIQFVPNFKFGSYEGISATEMSRPVSLINMTELDGTTPNGKGKIAPFVQITDGRGLEGAEAKWVLTAKASQFKNAAKGKDLGASYMQLNEQTLTTSMKDSAAAKEMVSGFDPADNKLGETPIVIMETNENKTTNGYQVSNVFQAGYTKQMDYLGVNGEADVIEGVKFHKPENVTPLADIVYTSTIDWTLTFGL